MRFTKDSFIIFYFRETNCTVLKVKASGARKKIIDASMSFDCRLLDDHSLIAPKIKEALKKINYHKERIILVISHKRVSCRFIKLPSQNKAEIGEMVYLQAVKDLPFAQEELVIGHQIVDIDQGGFSSVSMVFTRRDSVNRLTDIFKEEGAQVEALFLSTYGTVRLFNTLMPRESDEVLLVLAERDGWEITVLNRGKVYLSRFVSISDQQEGWQEEVFKQIMETQGLYLRQGAFGPIKKFFLMGDPQILERCKGMLDQKMLVPVETLVPQDSLLGIYPKEEVRKIPLALLGFLLGLPSETLSLLPRELREVRDGLKELKLRRRMYFFGITAVFILFLAFLRYTENRKAYLEVLNKELLKIENQAGRLEVMIRELETFRDKRQAGLELLDYFSAIHKVIPPGLFITSVAYEAKEKIALLLRGYSEKLDTVFTYASGLNALDVFKEGEIKVRQASKQAVKEREVVNFEIVFLRKK